jgi:hypothetical protein
MGFAQVRADGGASETRSNTVILILRESPPGPFTRTKKRNDLVVDFWRYTAVVHS